VLLLVVFQEPVVLRKSAPAPLAVLKLVALPVGFGGPPQVRVMSRIRTSPVSTRPATQFIGILRAPGDPATGDF
jgi:hypothetical protein